MYKSGFVGVVGRPNVGKSTLLNKIIGEKITIVTDKPQTTRNQIRLIHTKDDAQMIFLDTPGIQSPKNKLGDYMLGVSKNTLNDVDVVLFLVEPGQVAGPMDQYIFDLLKEIETPVVLILNKMDTITQEEQESLVKEYQDLGQFEKIMPISALDGQGVDDLLAYLTEQLPEGPQYFPDDMITDQPEKAIVAEMIREKAMIHLREEIPHGIAVEIVQMKYREDKPIADIEATIFVEKKSHKGMVIGKQGAMLKNIGQDARKDIEGLLGIQVNLKLWVKIADKWRNEERRLREFGYK